MRRYAAAVAALLVGLVVVVAPATPASAHTKLSKAVPAAKATVTKPVDAVTLTFSGLIKQAGTKVAVIDSGGHGYQMEDARAVDKTITQRIWPLSLGVITVAWQTVSADGHTISGTYTFTNKYAPPSPSPSADSPSPSPVAVTTTSASAVAVPVAAVAKGSTSLAWLAAVGAGAVAVLVVVVMLMLRRRRPRS